jgi:hypothetical protein
VSWGWDLDDMKGKKLHSCLVLGERDVFVLLFEDAFVVFDVEGDCCSRSWIEHLEVPIDLAGSTFLHFDESEPVEVEHPDHDCLKVYKSSFKTNRGEIVLEYRNSSNGYYGGSLNRRDEPSLEALVAEASGKATDEQLMHFDRLLRADAMPNNLYRGAMS